MLSAGKLLAHQIKWLVQLSCLLILLKVPIILKLCSLGPTHMLRDCLATIPPGIHGLRKEELMQREAAGERCVSQATAACLLTSADWVAGHTRAGQ